MSANPPEPVLASPPAFVPLTASGDGEGTTILLVEDENFVRDVTAEVLLFAGYRVIKARSAVEALTIFRGCGERVQLLLTDVVLPGRNGQDLAAELKAAHPRLKTIFISGYPENEVTRHGLKEPGMSYLPKPFSVAALMKRVRQVLAEDDVEQEKVKCAAAGSE